MLKQWSHVLTKHGLFLGAVVLPTLIATIYFGYLASDIYISESKFVVRTPQRQIATGIGALFQGQNIARSPEDAYTVQEFVLSRDAMTNLDDKFGLRSIFEKADVFVRFPELDNDASFEALHHYYQKRVTVTLDSESSIATLRTRAFNADDAHKINEALLELSEGLVNHLNERARNDLIKFANDEVGRAQMKAIDAALAVSRYRNQKVIFDPDRQSLIQLQQVSKIQDELIATKTQLAQMLEMSKDNPQIETLKTRANSLQREIDKQTIGVAGGELSLSNKAAQYDRLALESAFADKLLASALTSLETAKNEAQRQHLYLERIAQPNKPDIAVEPRRLRSVFTVLVLGLVIWGILVILIAGVREHRN